MGGRLLFAVITTLVSTFTVKFAAFIWKKYGP